MASPTKVRIPRPHAKQLEFLSSACKRKIIRAGRRGGKTTGVAIYAVQKFLDGRRVLYAAPTQEQVDRFWFLVTQALEQPVDAGVYYKNETKHLIERGGTENRIRCKTAWNADTLRGDYADELILDEFQLMNEDTWGVVGAPMLLDNNGNAILIYTPPSLHSRSASKANDPQHAAKLYKKAAEDPSGRWAAFHFTTFENPYIDDQAITELAQDMTNMAYRMEILAEEIDEAPGALWKRKDIESQRVHSHPNLIRIAVAVDPSGSSKPGSDEVGIVHGGKGSDGHYYVLGDNSGVMTPSAWGYRTVQIYDENEADRVVAETNYGGEMVETIIKNIDKEISYKAVHASRGKAIRAEPIAALYEQHVVHHVGNFSLLEDEMCLWIPGDRSPNRLDALVWLLTELSGGKTNKAPKWNF